MWPHLHRDRGRWVRQHGYGLRRTVHFSVAGGTATLPPDFTFTTSDKGRHFASATFLTSGAGQSLTVTDINDGTLTGTETGINVT